MNKKIVIGLIALMGVSIFGIIIVQLVWMNNAIRVKNELFDRSVNEALTGTTSRLEAIRDFRIINHFAFGDSGRWHSAIPVPPPPPDGARKRIPTGVKAPKLTGSPLQQEIEMIIETGKGKNAYHYQISTKRDSMLHAEKEKVIFVNTDSLQRHLDSLYAHGIHRYDSLIVNYSNSSDNSREFRQRVELKSRKLRRVASRVAQEIATWDNPEISTDHLNDILKRELNNRDVPIPYEFGIIKDSVVTKKSDQAEAPLLEHSPYQVNLFPNDIIQKNIRLAIYFPDRESFIYKTLRWLLLMSLFFSIVILLTFTLSIYFILKQKKISEMKSDFINNMTHEFKTPLATISVAADSVLNPKVIEKPEKIRYFIDMIKKENTRMNRQVEDILTIARLDKKDFEFKWEAFNLHEVIDDAMKSILLQVEKKGGTLHSELRAENPIATSDRSHFANLIYNLLDNANKYSPESPEIKVATRNTNKGVIITVEDKGIGMTRAVQSRIFERFYRQTSGNIHNVKGFGLGLSYVKAVLEANRGNISVHSEPGKGSRFEVFIPFIRE
jgi:two-component system phosphate regulon sensor histidine kinase PhoR